jgi:hypothetical protein
MSAPKNRVNIDTDRPLKPEISTAGQSASKESSMRCKKYTLTINAIDEGLGANLFWL